MRFGHPWNKQVRDPLTQRQERQTRYEIYENRKFGLHTRRTISKYGSVQEPTATASRYAIIWEQHKWDPASSWSTVLGNPGRPSWHLPVCRCGHLLGMP